MKTKREKTNIVQSLGDVPQSFASEDEERDWWASHEFSDDLYDKLPRPGWHELLPLGLRARQAGQVELPLFIAKKHLDYIRRIGERPVRISTDVTRDDIRLHHALVAIVFTAVAVEAGVNIYITAPALYATDERQRRFFALLATRFARGIGISQKLDFLQKTSSELLSNELVTTIRHLFERRNQLVHAGLTYAEPLGLRDDLSDEGEGIPDGAAASAISADLKPRPGLTGSIMLSSEDLQAAFEYYGAAEELLERLPLATMAPSGPFTGMPG